MKYLNKNTQDDPKLRFNAKCLASLAAEVPQAISDCTTDNWQKKLSAVLVAAEATATYARNLADQKASPNSEFGTFYERLEHFCNLKGIQIPVWPTENGERVINDEIVGWVTQHNANYDWLFAGSPDELLNIHATKNEFLKRTTKWDSELKNGLFTALEAVVKFGVPVELALDEFEKLLKEYHPHRAA